MAVTPTVTLLSVGRKSPPFLIPAVDHYAKMCQKYCRINFQFLKEETHRPPAEQIRRETTSTIEKLEKLSGHRVLLDRRGKNMDSPAFAGFLDRCFSADKNIIFVLGGINGFSEDIQLHIQTSISFSHLTLNHMLIRPFLIEQIFRGFSILNKTAYHR